MQVLSDSQLRGISRLIRDHHDAFLVQIGLGDTLPPESVERLLRLGLVSKSQVSKGLLQNAFLFGMLADALDESKVKNMDYAAFRDWLAQREVPLGMEERVALRQLKRSLATAITGLGNRIDAHTHKVLVEADTNLRRRLATAVKRELVQGVEKRKAIGEIASSLRKATGQYSRDWSRVAVTEMNNAFQEGKLATIQKANKGRDPLVFKRVRGDACEECKEAYLTKGGIPRVFKLSELLAAGSNIGKARHERRATVGSLHPWCQCELQELPPGFSFNRSGRMVYAGFGT